MENSNQVHLSLDLSTEQGKAILAAVTAAVLGGEALVKKEVKAPEAKVVKMPDTPKVSAPPASIPAPSVPAPAAIPSAPTVPALPQVPAAPSIPAAPSAPVAPPSIPTPPSAPTPPAAPKAPTAPAKTPKAPPVAKAPIVPFESLDEEGKREAIKKLTTKWSKKGKTTDVKALFAAYGAANVESVDASYLDHFNWAMTTFDGNGQDMAAVLSTFGAQ